MNNIVGPSLINDRCWEHCRKDINDIFGFGIDGGGTGSRKTDRNVINKDL